MEINYFKFNLKNFSFNYVKQLKSEGLPHPDDSSIKGDLFIHFDIVFPNNIPKHLRVKLASVLTEVQEYEEEGQMEKLCH